jgi:hypothetical protein
MPPITPDQIAKLNRHRRTTVPRWPRRLANLRAWVCDILSLVWFFGVCAVSLWILFHLFEGVGTNPINAVGRAVLWFLN